MGKEFVLSARLALKPPSAQSVTRFASNLKHSLAGYSIPIKLTVHADAAKKLGTLQSALGTFNKEAAASVTNINKMNAALTRLSANLAAIQSTNLKNVSKDVAVLNKQLTANAKHAKESMTAMESFGKQSALAIKRYAAFTIMTAVTFGFARSVVEAIKESVAFERELVKVAQVTRYSLASLKDLTNEISRLSTTYGVSSTKLVEVSKTLSQAGLSARETRIALEALAKTDVAATFSDLAQTTEGAIAIMRQFGLGASDLDKVLGSLNAVAGKFAVESSDLIAAVRRMGGVFAASSYGLAEPAEQLNQLMAIFTSVRATTRESSESIATGLRTIFTRMQRAPTLDFLERLGIDLRNAEHRFVGPLEAFRRLAAALNDPALQRTDILSKIVEQLGGFRQIGKLLPAITQFRVTLMALEVARRGQHSLDEEAQISQQALAIQIAKTKEEFLKLMRSITQSDSFKFFTASVLETIKILVRLADTFKPLLPLLTMVGVSKMFKGIPGFLKGFAIGLKPQADQNLIAAQTNNTNAVNKNTIAQNPTPTVNALTTNATALGRNTSALSGLTVAVNKLATIMLAKTTTSVIPVPAAAQRKTRGAMGFHTGPVNIRDRFSSGGSVALVPGVGNRDTVPAMLSAGSFVLNKKSTQMRFAGGGKVPALLTPGEAVFSPSAVGNVGLSNLKSINKLHGGGTVQRMADGGKIQRTTDKLVTGIDKFFGKIDKIFTRQTKTIAIQTNQLQKSNIKANLMTRVQTNVPQGGHVQNVGGEYPDLNVGSAASKRFYLREGSGRFQSAAQVAANQKRVQVRDYQTQQIGHGSLQVQSPNIQGVNPISVRNFQTKQVGTSVSNQLPTPSPVGYLGGRGAGQYKSMLYQGLPTPKPPLGSRIGSGMKGAAGHVGQHALGYGMAATIAAPVAANALGTDKRWKAAAGGALMGGSSGALMGGMIGSTLGTAVAGPAGTAIGGGLGAAIGGLIGVYQGITSSLKEYDIEKSLRDVRDSSKGLSEAFDKITKSGQDSGEFYSSFGQEFYKQRSLSVSANKGRKEQISELEARASETSPMLNAIIEKRLSQGRGVSNMLQNRGVVPNLIFSADAASAIAEQMKAKGTPAAAADKASELMIGKARDAIISGDPEEIAKNAKVIMMSARFILEERKKEIESTRNLVAALDKLNKAVDTTLDRFETIGAVAQRVSKDVANMSDYASTSSEIYKGGLGIGTSRSFGDIIGNRKGYTPDEFTGARSAIMRASGGGDIPVMKELNRFMGSAADLEKVLPEAFRQALGEGGMNADPVSKIMEAVGNIPPAVAGPFESALREALAKRGSTPGEPGIEDFLSEMSDVFKTLGPLGEAATSSYKAVADGLDQVIQQIDKNIQILAEAELEGLALATARKQLKSRHVLEMREAKGQEPTFAERNADLFSQFTKLPIPKEMGVGFHANAAARRFPLEVQGAAQGLLRAPGEYDKLKAQHDTLVGEGKFKQATEVQLQLKNLAMSAKTTRDELQKLSEDTSFASNAMDEISKSRGREKGLFGLGKKILTGGYTEQLEMQKQFSTFASARATGRIAPGTEKDFFGGLDLLSDILPEEAQRRIAQETIMPSLPPELQKEIQGELDKQVTKQKELELFQAGQLEAQKALEQSNRDLVTSLSTNVAQPLTDFRAGLADLLTRPEVINSAAQQTAAVEANTIALNANTAARGGTVPQNAQPNKATSAAPAAPTNGGPAAVGLSTNNLDILGQHFAAFSATVQQLQAMPLTLSVEVNHQLNVNINGAQAFVQMKDAFSQMAQDIVMVEIKKHINLDGSTNSGMSRSLGQRNQNV